MASLLLIRHGETEWSRTGRHTGVTDLALTATGRQQARRLAPAVAGRRFPLVLTSPRRRARLTAELAGLPDPHVDDDLAEWDYGGYEGLTTAEITARLGHPWTIFTDPVPPGATPGESLAQVAVRAGRILDRVRPVLAAGADVALVGHGHQLRVLTACWLGLAPAAGALFALDPATFSQLQTEHGGPVIASWNVPPDPTPPADPPPGASL